MRLFLHLKRRKLARFSSPAEKEKMTRTTMMMITILMMINDDGDDEEEKFSMLESINQRSLLSFLLVIITLIV